ncbi:MAG: ComEA family DNA-binding protein [Pirellulaceae bacterium]
MDEVSSRRGSTSVPVHPSAQMSTAMLVLVALGLVIATLLTRGIHRGELVDVDRTLRRPQHYTLDVNSALWPEWILLPGIGETLARRIAASREQEGPFQSHDDLLRVKGIGPRTLENMRKYLR